MSSSTRAPSTRAIIDEVNNSNSQRRHHIHQLHASYSFTHSPYPNKEHSSDPALFILRYLYHRSKSGRSSIGGARETEVLNARDGGKVGCLTRWMWWLRMSVEMEVAAPAPVHGKVNAVAQKA
ncbi:hypothetical protein OsJ_11405 [Oryza sativa Japonica Group]|uniref:Uncharacterized protein n=2 Tax=Oryza sativa subsp. japonica TaxID=39947 RepID=A0A9K3Y6Z8_ORYSJ|nr:hypothetical protein [Oryza sativa Japonica Group]ABF96846.1 hypothetical protein LOC_Os03g32570 [Oryza sativa Japonica Group]EAZ27457.1 hypothetical protein OsJ_11405 [Oryza sativa Japonica Group]